MITPSPAALPPIDRSIVLVGLMGAGKSSVGKRLAQRLGLPFVDADTEIEAAAGMTIAEIFAQHGEPHFREGERKVIARLLDGPPKVLATGGGAFMDPETRRLVRQRGRSVWLKAELDVLVRRCARRTHRPLLNQGSDLATTLKRLMDLRYPVYAEADLTVESHDGPHERVVEAIVARLGGGEVETQIETVPVELAGRSYDILVGRGLIADAGHRMKPFLKGRAVVVTDETVAGLHLPALRSSLAAEGLACEAVILPPGEETKSFARLEQLCDQLIELRVERREAIVALGGGAIGDLTGFAAAILRRGLDFVQVPTTLLAQVDSSVGGKTAINARKGKNLVGAFHQPRLVLADTAVLDSLPRRQLLAGYAEVAKYGLLGDAAFFSWLERHGEAVIAGDPAARRQAVVTSCRHKARIVAADEHENGDRALLNLGHTFGHALEAETGFSDRLLHGEAVAIGMCLAFELSARLGLCPREDAERARRHLAAIGLPTSPRDIPGQGLAMTGEALWHHMQQDKKVADGRITFVLARGLGQAFLTREVDPGAVRALLDEAVAA